MNKKQFILLLSIIFVVLGRSFGSEGVEKQIVFSIPPDGYPPYLIDRNSGILVDVLQIIAGKNGYSVIVVKIFPEIREQKMHQNRKVDVRANSKEWTENPDDFIFTDPIVEHEDVLIYLKLKPIQFGQIDDLLGKTIGTMLGYTYPFFEAHFADPNMPIERHDVTSRESMLEMLLVKRVDCAIINKLVALWTIKQNKKYQGQFDFSGASVGSVGYRLVFLKSAKWRFFVDSFNDELAIMKQNGELEEIIGNYR